MNPGQEMRILHLDSAIALCHQEPPKNFLPIVLHEGLMRNHPTAASSDGLPDPSDQCPHAKKQRVPPVQKGPGFCLVITAGVPVEIVRRVLSGDET